MTEPDPDPCPSLYPGARVLVLERGTALRAALAGAGHGAEGRSFGEALAGGLSPAGVDALLAEVSPACGDAHALCRMLRSQPEWDGVPLLLVGDDLPPGQVARGLDAGADDVMSRAPAPEELRARLDRLLARRQSLGEASGPYADALAVLARLCDAIEDETGAHALRVGRYAEILAEALGLGGRECRELAWAARFHDIGKFSLPSALVRRRGPLTVEEFEVVKEHAALGASLLGASPSLACARQVALGHHERWDGTGYPLGLTGPSIPLPARLALLADVYDALRRPRPYRRPLDHQTARRVLTAGDWRTSPEHFDPAVLDAFCRRHEEFEDAYEATESSERP